MEQTRDGDKDACAVLATLMLEAIQQAFEFETATQLEGEKDASVRQFLIRLAENSEALRAKHDDLKNRKQFGWSGGGRISKDLVRDFSERVLKNRVPDTTTENIYSFYENRYAPMETYIRREKNNLGNSGVVFAHMLGEERLRSLNDPEERNAILKTLIQEPMLLGNAHETLKNLGIIFNTANLHGQKVGLTDSVCELLRSDTLIIGTHALYRLGFAAEERALAEDMQRRAKKSRNPMLRSALLGHRHLRQITSPASLEALDMLERQKLDVALTKSGEGRLFVYAVETLLHRGGTLDSTAHELGHRTLKQAIKHAVALAQEVGDIDASTRFETVLIRGYLWQGDWESALNESLRIREQLAKSKFKPSQALMRLAFEEAVAYKLAFKNGNPAAKFAAKTSLLEANSISSELNIPILTWSHQREYRWLGEKYSLGDLARLVV